MTGFMIIFNKKTRDFYCYLFFFCVWRNKSHDLQNLNIETKYIPQASIFETRTLDTNQDSVLIIFNTQINEGILCNAKK